MRISVKPAPTFPYPELEQFWRDRGDLPQPGYGIDFPSAGTRVDMLNEALTVFKRLWTEESVTFAGDFYTLTDALCEPKPIQRPHPPIVIGGSKPRMLRVIARHADEWNMPSHEGPGEWGESNIRLDDACAEVGRDPAEVTRPGQLFLHPRKPGQVDEQLSLLPQYQELGCQHAVLSFYQPPGAELLERCAAL